MNKTIKMDYEEYKKLERCKKELAEIKGKAGKEYLCNHYCYETDNNKDITIRTDAIKIIPPDEIDNHLDEYFGTKENLEKRLEERQEIIDYYRDIIRDNAKEIIEAVSKKNERKAYEYITSHKFPFKYEEKIDIQLSFAKRSKAKVKIIFHGQCNDCVTPLEKGLKTCIKCYHCVHRYNDNRKDLYKN